MLTRRAIPVDEKLARGLAMAEVRAILRSGRVTHAASLRDEAHPVRAAFKPVAFRYATGRRPDQGFVDRLFAGVDAFFSAAPGTVSREAETLPPERGVPVHSHRYVTLVPSTDDPGCRSLLASCASLDAEFQTLSLCQVPMFEVELHAIERFHLRTRSGLVRDALAAFGSASLRNVGLFRLMVDLAEELPGKAFAMPFADGLVLGHACDPHPGAVTPHATIQFHDRTPLRFDRFLLGLQGSCRIATFLGPLEMSPARARLRAGMLDIAERHAGHLRLRSDMLTAPGRGLRVIEGESDLDRFERHALNVKREIRTLLAEPGVAAALGPGRTAPVVRPVASRDGATSRRRYHGRRPGTG